MTEQSVRSKMATWANLCRHQIADMTDPPYLDDVYEGLPADVPITDRSDAEVLATYQQIAQEFLAESPADLAVRFAVLYPLSIAGMTLSAAVLRPSPESKISFCHLVGLCSPEMPTDVRSLKFELHNSYLAEQWDRGAQILQRMALIGELGAAEISALRGHYMFLSVWGRRIEWELAQVFNDYPEGHDCFWPSTLPSRCQLGKILKGSSQNFGPSLVRRLSGPDRSRIGC